MPAASHLKDNKLGDMPERCQFTCGKEENIKVYTHRNMLLCFGIL